MYVSVHAVSAITEQQPHPFGLWAGITAQESVFHVLKRVLFCVGIQTY